MRLTKTMESLVAVRRPEDVECQVRTSVCGMAMNTSRSSRNNTEVILIKNSEIIR